MSGLECAGCRERDGLIAQLRACVAELEQRLAQQEQRLHDQEQRLRELEARLHTHSGNSSLPPSANPPSAPQPPPQPPTGRGRAALRQLLGAIPRGTVGSERWGAYGLIDLWYRQVCWAHLNRDFQKWVDYGGETAGIGRAGQAAVERVFELWRDFRQGALDRPGLRAALAPGMLDLYGALAAGASYPVKKAGRFCANLRDLYPALWTFARVEGVEPTNNHAERTLRAAVLWRKVSFGTHSPGGCRFVERILTTVQTLRLQQRDVLDYLHQAVAAHRAGQPAPALVPTGA